MTGSKVRHWLLESRDPFPALVEGYQPLSASQSGPVGRVLEAGYGANRARSSRESILLYHGAWASRLKFRHLLFFKFKAVTLLVLS